MASRALTETAWVSDGNYGQVRDIVWRRATALVWLDYAWPVIADRGRLPLFLDMEFEKVGRGAVQNVAERREQVGIDPLRGLGNDPMHHLTGDLDPALTQQRQRFA